ncbi:MAG: hypothetical protein LBG27_14090 [Spirochaetaceae bacterium]|jgi:O-methyltransferase involved in polyketide biosynthesis|nr:hypothetical protein [Spirochaetaceae bacterium]
MDNGAGKESFYQENVQNTMLIPLWGRSFASKNNPQILDDKEAIKIVDSLGYDFSKIEKSIGEFGGICYIARARFFDDIIKDYETVSKLICIGVLLSVDKEVRN